jgi:hypothetical protein
MPLRSFALVTLLIGACDLGTISPALESADASNPDNTPSPGIDAAIPSMPDAAPPGAPDAAPMAADASTPRADAAPPAPPPDASVTPPDAADCDNAVATVPSGHHNAGASCLGCHDQPQGASGPFTLAGTLYTAAGSTTTIAGATIRVTDANGVTTRLVTAANGNFWTTSAVAYPVHVAASECPNTTAMVSAVQSSGASCNSCHSSGSRIHLP